MDILEYAVLTMLWTVTIWRAPSAFRTPKQRALWLAFAAVTLSMTLRLPGIMHSIDTWTRTNNLSTLIKHWVGIIAAGAFIDFVVAIARPERERRMRPRHYVALTTMALMAALFQVLPREHEVTDFFEETTGNGWATAYYTVFATYLGVAMATATRLFWGSVRHARGLCLRFGIRLMGIGTTAGALYALGRVLYLLGRLTGITSHTGDEIADTITDLLKYCSISLILTGSSIPALGVAWRTIQDWRHLRQLQPLWRDLTTSAPDIVLKTKLLRGPRLQLHRCVIEIRDAGLALIPHTSREIREAANDTARTAGYDPETSPAAEALRLRAAHHAKISGAPIVEDVPELRTDGIDDLDFNAEVDRLLQLAQVYHSPMADAFLTRIRPLHGSRRPDHTLL
ncbi:MAB_1171c family putative transporter [Streptomyces sp. NPDC051183]|uniref:MAB_1171c family putative transporter n=1 Tax=Streptomyces sp. NPDC051183 TaxID=3155165 RepID=UPI00343136C4